MNLTFHDDRYVVEWAVHIADAIAAEEWCYQQYGLGWGTREVTSVRTGSGLAYHKFTFRRLYHAQWFMAKFNQT